MKLLIDECLHTSLAIIVTDRGHEAYHVNWLGLSGETDRDLMPRIVADGKTFVINNARDFRKLFVREPLADLVIIVPQVTPSLQRSLFTLVLDELAGDVSLLNEAIEIMIEDGDAIISRYEIPQNLLKSCNLLILTVNFP